MERTPDADAVKTVEKAYTYRRLNGYANSVAALIAGSGASEGAAGLLFEHGPKMIIAILGVLKSDRVYVPLEPILNVLTQTKAQWLVGFLPN